MRNIFFKSKAKSLQKTGGGDSQHSLRFEGTRIFSSRVYRYAAMILMLLTLGFGQMWGTATISSASSNASSAYYLAADGTAISAISGSGAKSCTYNNGSKITVDGRNNPDASITFTIKSGVTITSFTVNGTSQNNTSYNLDGTAVTFGTALTGLSKTSSMTFYLHCKDASSSSSNRNTTITSIVLAYTVGGGGDECSSPSFTTQPTSADYTVGASATSLTATASATNPGTITYKWQKSTDYGSNYSDIEGATNQTYSPSTATAGITYYRSVAMFSGGCSNTNSNAAIVAVSGSNSGTMSGSDYICYKNKTESNTATSAITSNSTALTSLLGQLTGDGKDNKSAKVIASTGQTYSFTVATGYTFDPTYIGFKGSYVGSGSAPQQMTFTYALKNSSSETLCSGTYVQATYANSAPLDSIYKGSIDISPLEAGTYTLVITGSRDKSVADNFRLGDWVTIKGTVAEIPSDYTLQYNANGGSGDAMANTTGTGTVTLRTNTYTKSGCSFQGWATSQENANAGTVAYADGATNYELSADATLYAVWKLNTPAISCTNNVVTITVPGGATVYYTTDGSTTPTSGSTAYDPSNKPVIAATTTFKAIAILANHVSSEVATQECAYVAPSTKRIYMKCGSTWCDDVDAAAPTFFTHSWDGSTTANSTVMQHPSACEPDVYYADIPASHTYIIFTRQKAGSTELVWSGDNFVNQSADITIGDNDLFTCTGWNNGKGTFSGSTYAAPTYTISFNAGTGTGTMASISSLACGANQAITANAFTKAGYAFTNWIADVAVTIGGETVAAGSAIEDGATIQNISGNIALTAQWIQAVPTSVSVDGTWRCFPGQTISLTATPTGGTSDFTYQWQKYVTNDWQDIDGEDGATYSKANCTISDCGSYRCIVSKLGGSVESNAFDVHIYTLNGNYNGSDWVSNDLTVVSGTTGKVELTLEAGRLYKFKVKDNFANYWFGNAGYMLKSETGWTCPNNESGDIRVFTGAAGTYTFTVDIANVNYGTPEVAVSVTYPSVTHPIAGYVYFAKGDYAWTNIAAHWWKQEGETATNFVAWENNPWLTQSVEICGTTYYYMPKLEGYNRVIFHNAEGEGQTSDITVDASSSGKYISGNSTEWTAFAKYTISFEGNGNTSGEMSAIEGICSHADQALTANAFAKTGYNFTGWVADVDVTVDESTITAGNLIEDAVTLKNVTNNITLTAQWESNCPASGTLFSITSIVADQTYSGVHSGNMADLSATVTNGSAKVGTTGNSGKDVTTNSGGEMKFDADGAVCLKLSLECELAEGDVIFFTSSVNKELKLCATSDGTYVVTVSKSYTIPAESPLIGTQELWIKRNDSGSLLQTLTISRPATVTLDATTNGGTAVDPIVGIVGNKVVLPHAFKSGKRFKGWYTDASAGTKQANYYTISASTTLYAQFEDIPASGTMFSLALEDELKPAANCTIKNAAGFVQPQDMIQYAMVSGGSAIVYNSSTNNHAIITTTPTLKFAGGSAYLLITFESALQEGDVITTTISGQDISYTTTSTRSTSNNFTKGTGKTLTITDGHALEGATAIYLWCGSSSNGELTSFAVTRPVSYTATLSPAGGSTSAEGWTLSAGVYTKSGILSTASFALPTMTRDGYKFDKWTADQDVTISEATVDAGNDIAAGASVKISANTTFTAYWNQAYAVTYAKGDLGADGTMTDSNSPYVAGAEVTLLSNTFTAPTGKEFDAWVVTETVSGDAVSVTNGKFTMPAAAVTVTATWKDEVVKYEITKGTHTNGDFTISVAEQEAGETVTLTATPDEDYLFSAWEAYKTGDLTTVTVTNNAFTMPAYAVTVNAIFAADPRAKVLYVTSNSEDDTKSDDKVYAALKDTYNVKIVGPSSDADQSGYALVVLHESITGSNYNATAVAAAKTGNTPVLNTKAYFYNNANVNNQRWNWGTPNAGKKTKGVHVNRAYCNITNHPLFNDLTPDENDSIIILSSINSDNKPIQPIGTFTTGKEGYTLANVPDGCAIHELTPAQRGAASGKYLLISLYSKDFANLNANGQKLFQNAAAYLIGNTAWEPISVLTSPAVVASPSAAYTVGDNIALTASATGSSAATTYTWYKGDTWAAAEEAGAIQAAATAAADGNIYGITGCALGDAGTYWCVISNGTGCDAKASLEITVSDVSYDIAFVSAHGTAPTATTGVSYTLPELSASGWEHQGWTASIDVKVDAATVTAGTKIANGKIATFGADVTFTAVWTQVFDVTFNMQSHGAAVAAQHILDGGKVTEPNDPAAIGWVFGGWYKEAACTNEWDFANDAVTDDTELFAKWTAFDGCTELWPATSGDSPAAVGDAIVMQTGSKGATMTALEKPNKLSYTAYGLQFASESGVKVNVVLNNDLTVGTKISLTLYSSNTGARGLHLYNAAGSAKIATLGWANATVGAEETFTYTVVAEDGLDGTHEFQLWRNNTVCLKSLKVESCGDAIIYHNLTSAITPAHDPAYATVTLGAGSVREGLTTTATYSAIDEAYEFDEWQISGTGATLSSTTANPVTITMGTADAVVTLKLKAATPKHTVTFNKMGKGDDISSQEVKEGDLVEEPSVTEPEGWILEGWYTENTFDNKWDFANDVMSTSDIELFANWVADPSIKLLSGSTVNHTDFITGVTAETVEISSVDYDCVKFSGTVSEVTGVKDLTRVIAYNAKTNKTKIQLHLYNTSTSSRTVLVKGVLEGNTSTDDIVDLASITLGNKEEKTTDYIEFNNAANRTIYIFISSSAGDVRFLQVKVIDDGTTPMKAAGDAGYSLNLNKGRFFGPASTDLAFEGLNVRLSGDYTAMNSSYAKLASTSMSFTVASAMTLNVTTNNNKTYYVTKGSAGTDNETAKAGVSEFDLTAGTWYITAGSNEVQFTNIAFIAPKSAEPAFNSLANSDICEGDDYVALNGTATVADAGTPIYQWYNADGDVEIEGATNATYAPTADGSYYVIATNQLAGFSDNTKKSATVTVTTHAGTAITEGLADQRGNVDDVVALAVVASGSNLHYAWKECATMEGEYTAVDGAADAASLNVTITEGMDKYYKVVVSSDCGADQESVAHVTQYAPVAQANVTGSIAWNWANAASVNEIKLTSSTSPKKNEGFVMANGAATIYNNANFESDKLYLEGEYITRYEGGNHLFQGQTIKFNATIAGLIRVKFSNTGNNASRELYINGVGTGNTSANGTLNWSDYVEVPAGEVSITAYLTDKSSDASQKYIRVSNIEFLALAERRTGAYGVGDLGTICLKDECKIIGATLYELKGSDPNGYMTFDELGEEEMLEAGNPYLFEVTNPSQVSFYKAVNAEHADEAGNLKGMYGTFTDKVVNGSNPEDQNIYYFSGRHIWAVKNYTVDITIPAYRCYVDIVELRNSPVQEAPAPGRRRVTLGVNGTNTATGMEEISQEQKANSQKLLINGELFILRGEKLYDATGRLVK